MQLLLATKGIHYFTLNDHNNCPVQFAFTDTMIENNLFFELHEGTFEAEIDMTDDEESDEYISGDDAAPKQIHQIDETSLTLSAIIDNQGVDFFILMEPELQISRMIIFGAIVHLAEILDKCPKERLLDYLKEACTSYFTAMQVKKFNPKRTLTRDTLKRIAELRALRDEKIKREASIKNASN